LFISVKGTEFIIYNSIVSPTACAAASESPTPLVKLDIVVPDIVPEIISLLILTYTVPELGKFVAEVSIKLVEEVVNAFVASVVDIPEDTPVMTTLLLVEYIP